MPVDKKIRIPESILDVFRNNIVWNEDGTTATLTTQVKNYAAFKKVVEELGGHWDKKLKTHVFPSDPREGLGIMLENRGFVVENYGYFDTPSAVVDHMIGIWDAKGTVLEPSAGIGAIAKRLIEYGVPYENITCIELHEERFHTLAKSFHCGRAIKGDFMQMRVDETGTFDSVFMNPPFEKGQDVDHIQHAFDFWNKSAIFAAVASGGVMMNSTSKYTKFREWVANQGGKITLLPEGSFKESGTGVNTCLVRFRY